MSERQTDQKSDQGELEEVLALVSGALERMGVNVDVEGRVDGRFVRLNVTGDDVDALVTGTGAAASSHILDAVQQVVTRRQAKDSARAVIIDAGGFREERLADLEAAATRLGDAAAERGDAVRIWGMSSFDRRAIHMALKERDDVVTDSEGEGVFRVLCVLAKSKKPTAAAETAATDPNSDEGPADE